MKLNVVSTGSEPSPDKGEYRDIIERWHRILDDDCFADIVWVVGGIDIEYANWVFGKRFRKGDLV